MAQNPNPPRKHHHVPEFYTKQWCGDDRRLCEYKRPRHEVVARRKFPSQTGFRYDLYTVEGAPPAAIAYIEERLLKLADQRAHDALQYFLSDRADELPDDLRIAWVRFIIVMRQRSPEKIASLRKQWDETFCVDTPRSRELYAASRAPEDPETLAEYLALNLERVRSLGTIRMLESVMDLPRTSEHLFGMRWSICTFQNVPFDLLTSDRPVIMTNGLLSPDAHVAVPIAPDRIFVAANRREFIEGLERIPPRQLIAALNNTVAIEAQTYVYGTDDSQLDFIEKRLGQRPAQTDHVEIGDRVA